MRRQPAVWTCSIAANTGSGFSTIPAPPPNGRSSAVRCLSVVQPLRSCTATWSRPLEQALPRPRSERNPSSIRGKRVRTSMRSMKEKNPEGHPGLVGHRSGPQLGAFASSGRSRRGGRSRGGSVRGTRYRRSRGSGAERLLDQGVEGVRGPCALAQPVVHPGHVELDAVEFYTRIVGAQHLGGIAIAARARLSYDNAVMRLVLGADAGGSG